MNTLSITSTKTMTYDPAASAHSFAIVEKLTSLTGALLKAARKLRRPAAPALSSAQA
jgi:hypothetical protein